MKLYTRKKENKMLNLIKEIWNDSKLPLTERHLLAVCEAFAEVLTLFMAVGLVFLISYFLFLIGTVLI